ncbi:hypothetical protein StoSoilB3_01300 [Arthrobacter sp. StoSoilB3]|nr:hypothetical protein NtRootA2_01290 [Arthrobacter sp. NtRootA2]BCW17038.1 hypothetical protein NtRootA4_40170 [Arthrobacter sp. NtRootA4]BCW21262.1 hypothetical protein NtRootC7_01290 [Arthrobacter sp. NtRootC7]BCW25529.1 hypothetical protein NtRootC45_01290 [Arthrobacter sp. NtRootC45]BCW29798.1 hypothetical protein NtRootD5_01290 [Arthrobacter sp. NtRootD5]BCW38595.1 hypothetical protein StoSoilB3_01300 [Arthrobacter sp. StoSoilB3]
MYQANPAAMAVLAANRSRWRVTVLRSAGISRRLEGMGLINPTVAGMCPGVERKALNVSGTMITGFM